LAYLVQLRIARSTGSWTPCSANGHARDHLGDCHRLLRSPASMYVIPTLLIGDRFQTLATLTARAFLLMRNEQLGVDHGR